MKPHFKTIIVDDEEASTYWLSTILTDMPEITLISVENNPVKALESIEKHRPDLLFLDIEMPVYSGFELLRLVRSKGLFPKVVFISGYQQYAIKAIKFLAIDYLLKPIDIDELRACINNLILNHRVVQDIKFPNLKLTDHLTPREEDVLRLMIEGRTSGEIALELFIGKSTVDSHRKSILLKTQAKNSNELVVWAAIDYFR